MLLGLMKETINEIMEYVKRKTSDFSYSDQAQIYQDLESRLADLNADALKNEYLGGGDDYLLDGV